MRQGGLTAPSSLINPIARYWELFFALDFNMGSLSKIIFLECQKQLPSFHSITSADGDQLTDQQLSPRCWCSAYTKTISDIPVWNHTPASKGKESLTVCEQQQKIISSSNPWIMNRCSQNIHLVCYYSSLLSFCSFTYYT